MSNAGWEARRSGQVQDLFRFLWQHRLWWIIPMLIAVILFGFLLSLGLLTSMGPFVYTVI